jgi:hypothetical protein
LEYFGLRDVNMELIGRDIHNLENILTPDLPIHIHFDALRVWLERTVSTKSNTTQQSTIPSQDTLHRYRICYAPSFDLKDFNYDIPEYIQLETTDQTRLPLPNPAYLALHASCCRVAHLSGAAEFLDWMDDQIRHECSFNSPLPTENLPAVLTTRLLCPESEPR